MIRGRVVPSVIGYFNERDKPITLWSTRILGTLAIEADDKGEADETPTADEVEIVRSPTRHAYYIFFRTLHTTTISVRWIVVTPLLFKFLMYSYSYFSNFLSSRFLLSIFLRRNRRSKRSSSCRDRHYKSYNAMTRLLRLRRLIMKMMQQGHNKNTQATLNRRMSQDRNLRYTSNYNRSSRRRFESSKQRNSRTRLLPPINTIGAYNLMRFQVSTLRTQRRSSSQMTRLSPRRSRRRSQRYTIETTRPIILRYARTSLNRRYISNAILQTRSPTRSSYNSNRQGRLQRVRRHTRRKDNFTTRLLLSRINRREQSRRTRSNESSRSDRSSPRQIDRKGPRHQVKRRTFPIFRTSPLSKASTAPTNRTRMSIPSRQGGGCHRRASRTKSRM